MGWYTSCQGSGPWRKSGSSTDKTVKYAYLRQWRGLAETEGACAVVRMGADGVLRDVNKEDLDRANELVWPVWE